MSSTHKQFLPFTSAWTRPLRYVDTGEARAVWLYPMCGGSNRATVVARVGYTLSDEFASSVVGAPRYRSGGVFKNVGDHSLQVPQRIAHGYQIAEWRVTEHVGIPGAPRRAVFRVQPNDPLAALRQPPDHVSPRIGPVAAPIA